MYTFNDGKLVKFDVNCVCVLVLYTNTKMVVTTTCIKGLLLVGLKQSKLS